MTAQLRKKMKKEIRAAVDQPEPILKSDRITPQSLLSRLPAKLRKKDESLLKSFEKKIALKSKRHKKNSKRTTPGTVDEKSPPQIIHIESRRWIKTTVKQNVGKRKSMMRQMSKKGSK